MMDLPPGLGEKREQIGNLLKFYEFFFSPPRCAFNQNSLCFIFCFFDQNLCFKIITFEWITAATCKQWQWSCVCVVKFNVYQRTNTSAHRMSFSVHLPIKQFTKPNKKKTKMKKVNKRRKTVNKDFTSARYLSRTNRIMHPESDRCLKNDNLFFCCKKIKSLDNNSNNFRLFFTSIIMKKSQWILFLHKGR